MSIPVIQASAFINATPATVWKTMTEQTSAMFMGAKVDTDWVVGHPITFSGEWKGKAYEDKGEIVVFNEGKELALTHYSPLSGKPDAPENYSLVRFTIVPAGERTRVTVVEEPAGGGASLTDEQKAEHQKNWATMLDALKTVSEADRSRASSDAWEKPPQLGR